MDNIGKIEITRGITPQELTLAGFFKISKLEVSNMPRLITAGSPLEFKVPHFQTMAGSLFVMSGSSRKPPGWWFQPTPLKNHGVKVSWDDDIPNGKNIIQSCSSHHQAEQSIFEWLEAKL